MKRRHGNSAAGGRAEHRCRSGEKQSQNLVPSMAESEQIAWNDREMKLELASEAVGRGRPATRAVRASYHYIENLLHGSLKIGHPGNLILLWPEKVYREPTVHLVKK